MTFQQITGCAALALGLALMATPAVACEGTDCAPTAKAGKPLQLGQFMHPVRAKGTVHVAKSAVHIAKKPVHVANVTTKAPKQPALGQNIPLPPVPAASQPLAPEAASAFASQPGSDVRVVGGDEVNEIDLAAGAALPETDGVGRQDALQAADTTGSSGPDRRSDVNVRMAALESAPVLPETPARAARTSLPWIERFWAAVQNTLVALAEGWRHLFG